MLIPVILSGGAGTRFWPVSREGHPKPFMKMADGQSLLQKTYRRAVAATGSKEILTVTNRDYYFMSKDELARASLDDGPQGMYLLEPTGRNTAPAVALAAHHLADKYGRDTLMLVLAADHMIGDAQAFNAAVADAAALARVDHLVTFGIVPAAPGTGFGYIECGATLKPVPSSLDAEEKRSGQALAVARFVEKPSLDKAREYLAASNFLWNSGMFCLKAGVILDELAKHAPDVARTAEACWAAMCNEGVDQASMLEIPAEAFAEVPDISIDYAVMEMSSYVAVVPDNFGWRDIGSWYAVSKLVEPDALLVAHPDRAQDIKKIVTQLKASGHDAYRLHRTVARPWGTFTVLEEGPRFKINRIVVKPGASLSLQMHCHRSEHWIVVCGMARVVNGEQEIFVNTNESTYIPAGYQHRLENPGILELVMIEVQSGEYLGEDDIVRFQDHYGRA